MPWSHHRGGAVIGAGSVVTRSIPPYTFAAGNPCKVIREITDEDRKYYRKGRLVSDMPGMPPMQDDSPTIFE